MKSPSTPTSSPTEDALESGAAAPTGRERFPLEAAALHDVAIARGPVTAIRLTAALLVLFLLWAWLTPVHEVARADGAIAPVAATRAIQHPTGGIVASVLVAEGDDVAAGAPLVRLDAVAIESELARVQARRVELAATRARLDVLAQAETTEPAALVAAAEAIAAGDALLAAQLELNAARLVVADEQVRAHDRLIDGLREQTLEADATQAVLDEEVARLDGLRAQGLARQNDLFRVQQARRQQVERRTTLATELQQAEIGLADARARRLELRQRLREEALAAAEETALGLAEATAMERSFEHRLAQTELRAPAAGRLHRLAVHGAGDVVAPGALVAEIVPAAPQVFAVVQVTPAEIGHIQRGQRASVDVATYDFRRFGGIEAVVDDIAPTSVEVPGAEPTFEVRLKLASAFVGPPELGMPARAGMTVRADIETGEKTIFDYLLGPLRDAASGALRER